MAWDMFGFLLHNLSTYQVVLHLLTMSLSIQAIQLYKTVRASVFKTHGFIPLDHGATPDDDADKKSDIVLRSGTKRRFGLDNRGRTFLGAGNKSSKASVVERFREKTMEMRIKK